MKTKKVQALSQAPFFNFLSVYRSLLLPCLLALTCSACVSTMEAAHREALFKNSNALIIDHTCTDISKIPDYWLNKAKELTIYYAHTSHGSQIISGAEFLAQQDPRFAFAVVRTNAENPELPASDGAICMNSTFGNSDSFWKSYFKPGGYTRKAADTGLFNFAMYSWCGEQSSNSLQEVKKYLSALDGYEKEYPHMHFIYMTGHTDGTNRTLRLNNKLIREYCAKHNKVLFDFADIESWSPSGEYYTNADNDCDWCVTWCRHNPHACTPLPLECAHSPDQGGEPERKFNCVLKGRAFWWMMARLAGWTSE